MIRLQFINRLFVSYCIIAGIIGLIGIFYVMVKYKKPKKKLLALQNSGGAFGIFAMLFQFPNFYFNMFLGGNPEAVDHQFSIAHIVFVTGIFTIISLLFMAYYETYKKLYNKAAKDYSQAFE